MKQHEQYNAAWRGMATQSVSLFSLSFSTLTRQHVEFPGLVP